MAGVQPRDGQGLLATLVRGAEKTFENAEQLFREAELLAGGGAVARALCLHQLSLEECSKVDTLGTWAVSDLLGFAVDQKKVLTALSWHAAKNKGNAYMLRLSEAEVEARERGDLGAALEAFKQTQDEFHTSSNAAKNAAMYVDWVDGAFVGPSERITAEMLTEITKRNAEYLGFASTNLRMLQRLETRPDDLRALLAGFVDKVEKLRDDKPPDMIAALDEMIAGFLEEGKARLRGQLPEQGDLS